MKLIIIPPVIPVYCYRHPPQPFLGVDELEIAGIKVFFRKARK